MTEIFISYSRRDKTFVEKFLKALNDNGYTSDSIWVDWEDIPSSSKWEEEIRKGVEKANSVVFILSPEWAISNECAKELKVAAEYNKRLFPIVCQNVDPKTIPAELASLNWIFFRETDNFDQALQKLLDALKTDLTWVGQHTKLLGQANQWQAKAQDSGYLLRGGELQEAETWLSQATEQKQPHPSQLQREYIFASRQDDIQRQRKRLIWVSMGLVVSIVLAIAAVFSGIEALRQSQIALASQLAAQATNLVDTQPDLALLLSLESNYIGDELGESDSAWLGSLITSLNSSPKLGTFLRAHDYDVRAVAFSPDGHWLATAGGDPSGKPGELILWDITSTANPKPYQKFSNSPQRMLGVAFSPSSPLLVAAGDEGQLYVWDTQNCCEPTAVWPLNGRVRGLAFVTLKGREYVAVAAGNQVTFWDIKNGEMNANYTIQPVTDNIRLLSLDVSPKYDALAVGSDDGNVTVWDLMTNEVRFQVCSYGDPATNDETICKESGDGETDIRGVAFNKEGTLVLSGSSDQRAWLWDAKTGDLLARSTPRNEGGHINTVTSVAFNPTNDHQVATVSWDNTVRIWDLIEDGDRWTFDRTDTLAGHANSIWATAFSPDGKWLASGSSDKTVILWKMNQLNQIGTFVAQLEGDAWALAVAPDGKQFAAGDGSGHIRIWNFDGKSLTELKTLMHEGQVFTLAFSHDGRWLASAGYDETRREQTINVWDVQSGALVWQIENAHTDQIWSVMFSPDDTWLASTSFDQTAKIWDTTTHQAVGKPLAHPKSMYALTFNDDGTQLFVAGYDPTIYRWDLTDPASIPDAEKLEGHSAFVNSLSFNPVYPPLMASTSDDKTLLIWNVLQREHTQPILGLNESMEAVAFRPSGDWLASATNNSTVLLWQLDSEKCAQQWNRDACQPKRLGTPLIGHKAPVQNLVYLTDTALVSSSADGQLILWNLDKSFWYHHACNIVNRPINDSEYSQYIEGKIKEALLSTVSWVSNIFSSEPLPEAPSCLTGSQP